MSQRFYIFCGGEAGGFAVSPWSSPNFLAFSPGDGRVGWAEDPETISFDALMQNVSIWASASFVANTFTMEAYDGGGALVETGTAFGPALKWVNLSVSSQAGIHHVVLDASQDVPGIDSFVYDDLCGDPLGAPGVVPEPTSIALLALATGGIGAVLRKRRRKQ